MLDYSEVEAPQGIKACWICGHTMELSQIESMAGGPNAFGERLVFHCANCGMKQTQCNAMPDDGRSVASTPIVDTDL